MAETFLFNVADRVLEKLVHLSVQEIRLAFNVKTDLKKLEDTMISIKAELLDAERQQHQNEKLRLSMWKLRDIFYDVEDVIDDFKCETLRKQDAINHRNTNSSKAVRVWISSTYRRKQEIPNHNGVNLGKHLDL
ncbi:putative disease resistance protein At1g50180 [Gossypium arboreum]|uniref:putative disease resistance protein At1g50180 n=1 Tax=Gossypium arboreum TaxID=29729 RepID=UPI0022F1CBDD|nr:putative disease resistance protein At1g50180 [Gossypium arboreum]